MEQKYANWPSEADAVRNAAAQHFTLILTKWSKHQLHSGAFSDAAQPRSEAAPKGAKKY